MARRYETRSAACGGVLCSTNNLGAYLPPAGVSIFGSRTCIQSAPSSRGGLLSGCSTSARRQAVSAGLSGAAPSVLRASRRATVLEALYGDGNTARHARGLSNASEADPQQTGCSVVNVLNGDNPDAFPPGGIMAVMGDGCVALMTNEIAATVFAEIVSRDGSQFIPGDCPRQTTARPFDDAPSIRRNRRPGRSRCRCLQDRSPERSS